MTHSTPSAQSSALDLLPCPFCGGEAHATTGFTTADDWPNGHFDRVFCTTCQIRQLFHRTKAEAVAAWNRRATPAGTEAPTDEPFAYAGVWRGQRILTSLDKKSIEDWVNYSAGRSMVELFDHPAATHPADPSGVAGGALVAIPHLATLTQERVLEVAKKHFGWVAGCGGFDDAVLHFITKIADEAKRAAPVEACKAQVAQAAQITDKNAPGYRPPICDGGGSFSACCDGRCAADVELAEMALATPIPTKGNADEGEGA